MPKFLKITFNLIIFAFIAGFGYFIFHATMSENITTISNIENQKGILVSPYKKINSFDTETDIQCFTVVNNKIYVALKNKISVFDVSGKHQYDFTINTGARDIVVEESTIYLLYPTTIALYSFEGAKFDEWKACSENSDYFAFTTSINYFFVTDVANKLIHQYNKQGVLVRFIKSPNGFIIPSYSFDIININDTLYCTNSGRHQIESYTIEGEFITAFGKTGTQAGCFSGCCNPVYLEKSPNGSILTSEKGNPRISSYGKEGEFYSILFDRNMLCSETSACKMHVDGENIFIAHKKTITVFCLNVTRNVQTNDNTDKICVCCPYHEHCNKQ